jgi:hypothetical protein
MSASFNSTKISSVETAWYRTTEDADLSLLFDFFLLLLCRKLNENLMTQKAIQTNEMTWGKLKIIIHRLPVPLQVQVISVDNSLVPFKDGLNAQKQDMIHIF